MTWQVLFHDEFAQEFDAWHQALQDELFAQTRALKRFGPDLGRPWVDTLSGSRYANMKNLRFSWRGAPWRVAFAFDPQRQAVLLVGGCEKRGESAALLCAADSHCRCTIRTIS